MWHLFSVFCKELHNKEYNQHLNIVQLSLCGWLWLVYSAYQIILVWSNEVGDFSLPLMTYMT